ELYNLSFAEPLRGEAVQALKRYAALEDIEVEESRAGGAFAVQGPRARDLLGGWIEHGIWPEEPFREETVFGGGIRCFVRRSVETPAGGWQLRRAIPPLWRALVDEAQRLGGGAVGPAVAEVLRIEAGIPRWGVDLDGSNFPNECGWEEALNYDKGCYIGQEVIARMRTYGHLNKRLLRVRFGEAAEAPPGARLYRDGKEVGQVTSSAASFLSGRVFALAYLRQPAWEPGTILQVGAADGPAAGEVLPLGSPGSRS
ncbi:MAG: YgfZ/GcvT domain-containing protein, partial [Thermoanaerobaculia bacterium]